MQLIYKPIKIKNNEEGYTFPGGGWDPNEDPLEAAIRETQEEARMNVKDIMYGGNMIEYYEEPVQWVKDNVPKKDWWYGYYTEIFVGIYKSYFNGKVDEIDQDQILIKGKWRDINKFINMIQPEYRKAIEKFMNGRYGR